MRTVLYFLCFALLLPCEMLIWGKALDESLAHTYLAQRLSLNILMDIPGFLLIAAGLGVLYCIFRGSASLQKESHAEDGMLYGSVITGVALLFLYFRLPCSFALILPLMCIGAAGAWYAAETRSLRKSFLLAKDMERKATLPEYFRAFHLLFGIQCAGCILFQSGYSFWFSYPLSPIFAFIPFIGLIQRTPGQLRNYIHSAFGSLLLCAGLSVACHMILEDAMMQDLGIFLAALFVILQCMLFIRQWFRRIRNLSILLLIPATLLSLLILPGICSVYLIPLTAFLLYLLLDNAGRIRKKLFSFVRRKIAGRLIFTRKRYKAVSWGAAVILTAYLLGENKYREILICIGVLLAGALFRAGVLRNRQEDHIILRNFPHITEVIFLGIALLVLSRTKAELLQALCAFACGASLLQSIWYTGEFLGKSGSCRGVISRCFPAVSSTLLSLLMILLFHWQLPAGLYLGIFLILSGILRVRNSSFHIREEERRETAGWVLVILGQFISVTSPEITLSHPEWYGKIWYCALFAVAAALYTFHILDARKIKKETLS